MTQCRGQNKPNRSPTDFICSNVSDLLPRVKVTFIAKFTASNLKLKLQFTNLGVFVKGFNLLLYSNQ